VRLGLVHGHPGDALELGQLGIARLLQLFLQLLRVHLAIGDSLFPPRELGEFPVDVLLLGDDALLQREHLRATARDLLLDLGAKPDRLLTCFDLSFAPKRIGLPLRLGDEQLSGAARSGQA